jgi:hypothetical protein
VLNRASVYSINSLGNGRIVLTGLFNSVNGLARQGLAAVNADGTVDPNINPALVTRGFVTEVPVGFSP